MKKLHLKKFICILMSICMLFSINIAYADTSPSALSEVKGLFIDPFEFENISTESEAKSKISEVIDFASSNYINTIYFKTIDYGTGSYNKSSYPTAQKFAQNTDILDYAVKLANEKNIAVVSWINPWNLSEANPEQNSISHNSLNYSNISDENFRNSLISEIKHQLSNYDISGVLIDTDFYPDINFNDESSYMANSRGRTLSEYRQEQIFNLVSNISKETSSQKKPLGIICSPESYNVSDVENLNNISYSNISDFSKNNLIDYVIPKINVPISSFENKDFLHYMQKWSEFKQNNNNIQIIPFISASNIQNQNYDSIYEIDAQILASRNMNADGFAINGYSTLLNDNIYVTGISKRLEGIRGILKPGDLRSKVDTGFKVTRPSKEITVQTSKYYIMGVCDPNSPIYCNDTKIESIGNLGTFGHQVELSSGKNTFKITQGTQSETIIINYNTSDSSGGQSDNKISKIVQSSMAPKYSDTIRMGEYYTVSCTAPSGSSVKATILGNSVELKKVSTEDESSGTPVKYQADIQIPNSFNSGEVSNAGHITYTLSYNGETSEFESNGNLFVADNNTEFRAMAKNYMTPVYATEKANYDYYSVMHQGITDIIIGQTSNMFKLSQGGYVLKDQVTVLTGKDTGYSSITDVIYSNSFDQENLLLVGAKNTAFSTNLQDSIFTISMSNVNISDVNNKAFKLFSENSQIFSDVKVQANSGKVDFVFTLKNSQNFWGYNIENNGSDSKIIFKRKPSLSSDSSKPLSGITIMLDPGHGGSDPGAIGPAGFYGPVEKDLTLMTALKTKEKLESLGATVYMTRQADYLVELYERASFVDKIKPDMFVSIHINSTDESFDGSTARGTEVYYFSPQSEQLANNLLNSITSATNRNARKTEQGVYVVTRSTISPSVLCELGFINNPSEYENMIQPSTIDKTAQAITDGILQSFK